MVDNFRETKKLELHFRKTIKIRHTAVIHQMNFYMQFLSKVTQQKHTLMADRCLACPVANDI